MTHPRAFVLTISSAAHRLKATQEHLREVDVKAEPFYGLDYRLAGIETTNLFERNGVSLGRKPDGSPREGEVMGPKPTTLALSHYMLWKMLSYLPEDSFWCLEDDARFENHWPVVYQNACRFLPSDWDIVFLGSCAALNAPRTEIGGGLWDVRYPMCLHALQIRKKALPILLREHARFWAPLDIAMVYDSLPKLKVYTIFPRMVNQWNTGIPD